MLPWNELEKTINELETAINENNHEVLREILIRVISDFKPEAKISDLLH